MCHSHCIDLNGLDGYSDLSNAVSLHVCNQTCPVGISQFSRLPEPVPEDDVTMFPPPPLSRKSAMHIVRDFCTDFIPENIEEQGCTVCGQLSLVKNMRSLDPAIHNLDVLRSPNSQVERFEAVDPIWPVEGPLLAPGCDRVCDRCHESKMPLCRVKRDSFLPHEVMARSH